MSPLIGYRGEPLMTDPVRRLHGHIEFLSSYYRPHLPEPVQVALDNLIDVIKENKK